MNVKDMLPAAEKKAYVQAKPWQQFYQVENGVSVSEEKRHLSDVPLV